MMPTVPDFLNAVPFRDDERHASGVSLGGRTAVRGIRVFHPFLAYGLAIAVIVLLAIAALPAAAQDTPTRVVTDDEVNAVANKLFCPVCENITLDTCGTAACADWRYEIRLQLEAGMTEQQIIEDFVHRFGDRVVGTPLDPLLRAVSLFTPWLVIAAALVVVIVLLVRRKPTQPLPTAAQDAPTNRYQDLFEQDIRGT